MPVPTLVTDLSTTVASNSPAGSDNVFPDLDNYLRALSGFVASIRDNSGNGWVSPYLPLAGGTVTGATIFSSTVALNGALSGTGLTTYLASPPAIGGTTPAAGSFTTLAASGNVTLSGGTANGVLYLNGSKVATSGSALTFDGSEIFKNSGGTIQYNDVRGSAAAGTRLSAGGTLGTDSFDLFQNSTAGHVFNRANTPVIFGVNNAEQMRLTSTGLGIGTSSPASAYSGAARVAMVSATSTNAASLRVSSANASGELYSAGATTEWGLYSASNSPFSIWTNNNKNLTLDSSGNLGLGVTPSAVSVSDKVVQVGAFLFNNNTNGYGILRYNNFFNGTNDVYYANGSASAFQMQGNAFKWYTAPSGTAGNAISFTQAMTLDASGNLLVGTTSAGYSASGRGLIEVNGSSSALLALRTGNTNRGYLYTQGTDMIAWAETGNFTVGTAASAFVSFNTNNTERARITSGGNLLVGTVDDTTANKFVISGTMAFNNGSTIPQINYYSSASTIEYVNRDSGGSKTFSWYYQASGAGSPATLSTSGVWTNASDARGKENISEIHYGLDTVMALQPRQYDVKSDGSHAIGFVAQEVLPVVPELVHVTRRTENDEFYGLDYGSMTAVLVKAIQEQQALITALTARVAALEAQP